MKSIKCTFLFIFRAHCSSNSFYLGIRYKKYFYTTKNKGSIDPECIAVVSKLNVSQDYYFAYQSHLSL